MRRVRRATPADWPAVRALCAETGLQGDPVPGDEAESFAERWIGPYQALRPDWTFVAEEDGRVVAYLTGCPDSAVFEAEARAGREPTPDSRSFFGADFLDSVWARHPGHLHMNAAEAFRGRGIGRELLKAFFAALKDAGVGSAHVFSGNRALGYWVKAGFSPIGSREPAPGVFIHALARAV